MQQRSPVVRPHRMLCAARAVCRWEKKCAWPQPMTRTMPADHRGGFCTFQVHPSSTSHEKDDEHRGSWSFPLYA